VFTSLGALFLGQGIYCLKSFDQCIIKIKIRRGKSDYFGINYDYCNSRFSRINILKYSFNIEETETSIIKNRCN
jgi:hypothetical protein